MGPYASLSVNHFFLLNLSIVVDMHKKGKELTIICSEGNPLGSSWMSPGKSNS